MKAIAIIANLTKPGVDEVAGRISRWCQSKGIKAYAQKELKCGTQEVVLGEPLPDVDIVMVLGGDGTFLSAARIYADSAVPLLGVNLGNLGFLTEIEVSDLDKSLEQLARDQYYIEKRAMLSVKIIRHGREVERTFALNEATIAKGPLSRIIHLDVLVDGILIGSYFGDGMIVSTPTGSTGYSLSAGGPLVAPNVDVVIITPICPHTLHARPVVAARDALITVDVKSSHQEIVLTVDGQDSFSLQHEDRLEVSNSRYETALVRLAGNNFFDVLRRKLMEQNRKS